MAIRQRIAELLEPTHRDDRLSQLVNLSLILLIVLNVLAIILESVESVHREYQAALWYFEVFSVAVFTVEYIARVWVSIDLSNDPHPSPLVGRLRYMLSPMALIDLLAILPFYLSLYLAIDLRFLRVLRLLRLFKLTRYSPALSALLDVIQRESEALMGAIVILLIMLVISASGIYLMEHDVQPDEFGSIPDAMWWAIATLTTVGYGDAVPLTSGGKFFGGLVGLIGVGMVALPAAIMASGFAENLHQRKQRYRHYVRHALNDGELTDQERWELERLRKELNLDSAAALELLNAILSHARSFPFENCPHCGEKLDRRKKPLDNLHS
jgi:voltage-gated potassium channel